MQSAEFLAIWYVANEFYDENKTKNESPFFNNNGKSKMDFLF